MSRVVVAPLVALFVAFASLTPALAADPTPDGQENPPGNVARAKVLEVVDGDTIRVRLDGDLETVRLIGIDTPETKDPNTPDECWGEEASDHATRLLQGRTVWLETDVSDTDQYGRLLRYVWFQGKSDKQFYFANEVLVRRGYAVVSTYPPDVEHVDRLTAAQDLAIAESIGLWPGCGGADTPLDPAAQGGVAEGTGGNVAPVAEPPIGDCAAFGSFDEANAYYAQRPDATALDPNGDGRAYEVFFGVDAPVVEAPAQSPAQGLVANPGGGCDPSYPGLCIPVGSADIDCPEVGAVNFTVFQPDPHGFDRDVDGIGCEA